MEKTRSKIERVVRQTLLLGLDASIQVDGEYEAVIEARIAQGRLSRDGVIDALILLELLAVGVDCEIRDLKEGKWTEEREWVPPDLGADPRWVALNVWLRKEVL